MRDTTNRLPRPFGAGLLPTMSREFDALQANLRRAFEPFASPFSAPFATPFATPFGGDALAPAARPLGWIPPVEIVETPDALVLTAELPGMTREQLSLVVDGDVLTLSGEKRDGLDVPSAPDAPASAEDRLSDDRPADDRRYHLFERGYGAFVRSFTLPRAVDVANVRATLVDGVLTCVLPTRVDAAVRGTVVPIATAAPSPKAAATPERPNG